MRMIISMILIWLRGASVGEKQMLRTTAAGVKQRTAVAEDWSRKQ